MNEITQEDLDMLYWHAVAKMRQGSFKTASQFFGYVFGEKKTFCVGLALAYSFYRDGNPREAKEVLMQIMPTSPRETKFHERLLRRVS